MDVSEVNNCILSQLDNSVNINSREAKKTTLSKQQSSRTVDGCEGKLGSRSKLALQGYANLFKCRRRTEATVDPTFDFRSHLL